MPLRKEDRELWEAMVREVREGFGDAVEKSGMPLTIEPFFMSLLLAQQRAKVAFDRIQEPRSEDATVGL